MNVLITNIGRRGYLVDYLKGTESFFGKVFVSDCSRTASGLYGNNDGAFILPKPLDDEKGYVESLVDLCQKLAVAIVIPVIDPEIDILSKYVAYLSSRKIFVAVSNREVLNVCWSKLSMNEFLKKNSFDIPATYKDISEFKDDYRVKKIDFPVMLKPVFGSGSADTHKASSLRQLEGLFHDGLMIQELLDGQEYGCDVFNDLAKRPVRCVIKKKLAMRSGETDKAITIFDDRIQKEVLRLAEALGHICNLDCDVIDANGKLYFIDLNPRFGGGYPMSHASGVNYLELILKMADGKKIEPEFYNYKAGVLVMKTIGICAKQWEGEDI